MHTERHFQSSDRVKDIVIGMSDGLTVPFALAAGLSGAVDSNSVVLIAGIAEIVAGSIAMGLGGYLAGRTEQDHYRSELQRERGEVEDVPEREREEVREVLQAYGVAPALAATVAEDLAKDKGKWVDFMMRFELGLERPDPRRAGQSAVTIALSYALGGALPLVAYVFTSGPREGLLISCAITLVALLVFGWAKSKATGRPPFQGALRTAFIGAIAAGAAYGIARSMNG